jgi:hypothetical protein
MTLTKLQKTYNFTTKSYLEEKKGQKNFGRGKVLLAAGREFPEAAAAAALFSRFCVPQWFLSNFNFVLKFYSAGN